MKIMQQKANKRIFNKAGIRGFCYKLITDFKCEERRRVIFYRLIAGVASFICYSDTPAIRPHTLQSLLKTDNSRIC